MLDFLLGAVLVGLVIRGWMRGFVREAIGLAVLVVGTVAAFRLSGVAGDVVSGVAGTSPDLSRLVGGLAVFVLISAGAALVASIAQRGIRALPGLPTVNRVGGAALAAAAGLLVATIALSVLTVLPVPPAVARQIDESQLAGPLTNPDGLPQRALGMAGGDQVMAAALRLDGLMGTPGVGDPGAVTVLLAMPDHVSPRVDRKAAAALRNHANRARVTAGVAPLAASPELDAVARGHAVAMYAGGWIAHIAPDGHDLEDRLADADLHHTVATELIGLGATAAGVVDSWVDDPASAPALYDRDARKMGAAIVVGPFGSLAVMVTTG